MTPSDPTIVLLVFLGTRVATEIIYILFLVSQTARSSSQTDDGYFITTEDYLRVEIEDFILRTRLSNRSLEALHVLNNCDSLLQLFEYLVLSLHARKCALKQR
jgi:hypothetical protein